MRTAQNQRRQRSPWPEKRNFVELEQRQIGGFANGDLAEFGAADAGRRSLRRPAKRVLVADAANAVTRPLQQERRTHLLHEIGPVIRGRAIDAEPDSDPASSMSQTGQQPDASSWLLQAQWLMLVFALPRRLISSGLK